MIERETNVLNELDVVQGALTQSEEWVVVDVETPVMEELEKAETFLAVGTGGWDVAKYALILLFGK